VGVVVDQRRLAAQQPSLVDAQDGGVADQQVVADALPHLGVDLELLAQLAHQCLLVGLARVDLAAGELPEPGQRRGLGAPAAQHAPHAVVPGAQQGGTHHRDARGGLVGGGGHVLTLGGHDPDTRAEPDRSARPRRLPFRPPRHPARDDPPAPVRDRLPENPMTRWPAALLALALAVTVTACSNEPEAERDEAGAIATEGAVDAFSVALGDCLNEPPVEGDEAEVVESVRAAPCDQPHTGEVFALFDLPDGDFPGDDAVTTAAEEGCLEEFDAFVGLAYEESALDFYTLQPTQDSWEQAEDREVVCVLEDPETPEVTGSLKGAAR
jgi:hypothetical protein